MTKNDFKAALDLAGVAYPRKANLATLMDLFDTLPGATTGDEPTPEMVAEAGSEPLSIQGQELIANILLTENGLAPIEGTHGAELLAGSEHGNCPGCGIDLSNGFLTPDDEVANSNPSITYWQAGEQHAEMHCMGCGHEWGAVRAPYVAPTGLKIEKERPESNGVKRPSIGGKCRAIWDALDAYRAETGELPDSKVVKALAADEGWNPNNASIEYYQWRKFNGIAKGK